MRKMLFNEAIIHHVYLIKYNGKKLCYCFANPAIMKVTFPYEKNIGTRYDD